MNYKRYTLRFKSIHRDITYLIRICLPKLHYQFFTGSRVARRIERSVTGVTTRLVLTPARQDASHIL